MNTRESRVRVRSGRESSFTLIELLVVVAIIMILVGISIRVTNSIYRKIGNARCAYIVEQTRNAVESYYLAKGQYPPTAPSPNNIFSSYFGGNKSGWQFDVDNVQETTGLVYYLAYQDDPQAQTWRKYVVGVDPSVIIPQGGQARVASIAGIKSFWTNSAATIQDGFGRDIVYQPDTNDFQSYKLYSMGADGKTGGSNSLDDITGMESIF